MTFKIRIKTIEGNYLTFSNVQEHEINISEGIVSFTDNQTKLIKRFPISRADIEEEK